MSLSIVGKPSAADPKAAAISAPQEFLRLAAREKWNLACTQVLASGLLNPCMDDLSNRDLRAVTQAGRWIVVRNAELDGATATVTGQDTRPVIAGEFVLRLHLVGDRWLVDSINGSRIQGSG